MFRPVLPKIWRWETPDPEDHWLMVGHLIQQDDRVIVIDPPMTPTLPSDLWTLGGIEAIILTTHDHTRGARYLAEYFQCPVYVPEQARAETLHQSGLHHVQFYGEGDGLPGNISALRCRIPYPIWQNEEAPYLDEMSLILPCHVVVSGDIAMGSPNGHLWVCPEGFNDPADIQKVQAVFDVFQRILPANVTTLLAGHGTDLVGTLLQEMLNRKSIGFSSS
ncbi:MBL fold metallo-hydrolase [Sulfobacillus thermosulfidooxidans]|uniref:MBL fold metallo-hydrolase n=1 Tax=Sulfobacillus thermosulfidooxidans TaxID=28034 RepID=UPI0006B453B3|nr:MBL fold metallo-hydrolase [Sulfobacillus thermosulfidooxidans]